MIREWSSRCFNLLLMILSSDSAVREFTADEYTTLDKAATILGRHLP